MNPEITVSGTIDIVEHAGVDFALGARNLLPRMLIVDDPLKFVKLLVAPLELDRRAALLRRMSHRSPHGGNIERLVQIIAGPETERLPRCLDRLVCGQHDYLDGWIDRLQLLQKLHPGHSHHHDIANRYIDVPFFRDGNRVDPVRGEDDLVVVFKYDAQGLARAFFIIDDQEGGFRAGNRGWLKNGIQWRRGGLPSRAGWVFRGRGFVGSSRKVRTHLRG